MERLEANEKTVKDALSKQPNERWRETVILWVTKCGWHFRAKDDPLTDVDFEIFLDGLRHMPEPERVARAFEDCMRELEFMPRLSDVRERDPGRPIASRAPDLKLVKEWDEPYGEGLTIHYTEYEGGYRQSRIVRAE
jgi:hypothetical protein